MFLSGTDMALFYMQSGKRDEAKKMMKAVMNEFIMATLSETRLARDIGGMPIF